MPKLDTLKKFSRQHTYRKWDPAAPDWAHHPMYGRWHDEEQWQMEKFNREKKETRRKNAGKHIESKEF